MRLKKMDFDIAYSEEEAYKKYWQQKIDKLQKERDL